MTGTLRAASCLETVDFPVAMPPVRPMTIRWHELWIARVQVCTTYPTSVTEKARAGSAPLSGMATRPTFSRSLSTRPE